MFYCCVISDPETIASIKDEANSMFGSFQEPEFGEKVISWMATDPLLDNFKALIKKYPCADFDIASREEDVEGWAYSIYAPGDGSAVIVEYAYDDFVSEDAFDEEPVDGYDDWYDYYDDYFNIVNDNPENNAKTSKRAKQFV